MYDQNLKHKYNPKKIKSKLILNKTEFVIDIT